MRKKKKQSKPEQITVSPEIIQAAMECSQMEATTANFVSISNSMASTHLLLMKNIMDGKSAYSVLQIFPHLKSYNCCGSNVVHALDTFFKAFKVLNVSIPPSLG